MGLRDRRLGDRRQKKRKLVATELIQDVGYLGHVVG
jgi:hypothetical protein